MSGWGSTEGKYTEAVNILKTLYPDFEKADGGSKAALAYALIKAGQRKDGENLLQRIYELNQPVEYRLAACYAAEHKFKKAISLLKQAYKENWMVWLKYDPAWDDMRNLEGFKKLLRKMNFD